MIDEKLLERLGWDKNLIEEINRVSEEINEQSAKIGPSPSYEISRENSGSSQIFVDQDFVNADHSLFLKS